MRTNDGSYDYGRADEKKPRGKKTGEMKALEDLAKTCPFSFLGENEPPYVGIYLNAGPVPAYQCEVDGGEARGGARSLYYSDTVVSPCSIKYAEKCPLYQKRVQETTFKNKRKG